MTEGPSCANASAYIKAGRDSVTSNTWGWVPFGYNITGSSHNRVMVEASYWDGPGSGPGIKADGFNKFVVSYEAGRESTSIAAPGQLYAYTYHPEQRDVWGDVLYADGTVRPFTSISGNYTPSFVSRPMAIPTIGKMRLRDTDVLTMDRFELDMHANGANSAVAKKFYDNVVAATAYIGCPP